MPDTPYTIDPPDADGFVWLCDDKGHHCFNLGTLDEAREMFSQWLAMMEERDGY